MEETEVDNADFENALFFNNLEKELAIFEALIQEVDYFLKRYQEPDLSPEELVIRKEDLSVVFDQYRDYKKVVRPLLEEYSVRVGDSGRPIHFGYMKILKQLREEKI